MILNCPIYKKLSPICIVCINHITPLPTSLIQPEDLAILIIKFKMFNGPTKKKKQKF